MNRRAFLAGLAATALAGRARAQTGATRTQIDLALAQASLAALLVRYGEQYPDVQAARARIAALSTSLREARARHETIDVAAATSTLEGELADVRARLAEFGTRCSPGHTDTQTARAREAALVDAIARLTSEGAYLP